LLAVRLTTFRAAPPSPSACQASAAAQLSLNPIDQTREASISTFFGFGKFFLDLRI
jgi:hypothetical protein